MEHTAVKPARFLPLQQHYNGTMDAKATLHLPVRMIYTKSCEWRFVSYGHVDYMNVSVVRDAPY